MVEETKEFFESLNIAKESIVILQDQPKDQIAAYFEGLVQVSEAFEKVDKNVEKNVLAILVRWIGFEVSANPTISGTEKEKRTVMQGVPVLKEMETMQEYEKGHNVTTIKLDHYGMTSLGEPFCIEAYCAQLASQSLTHVVLI